MIIETVRIPHNNIIYNYEYKLPLLLYNIFMKNMTDIIDYNKNYYEILGIPPEDLPKGKDLSSRRLANEILRRAYHKKLFEVHPDRPNGDEEKCKLVIQAHMILSDPILRNLYDNGGIQSENFLKEDIKIDWSKLGKYRKGSLADMIGKALFEKILNESGIENITVKFSPFDEEAHNYQWEFNIEGLSKELVLTIIEDENEVLKLTKGDDKTIKKSLPFKIYICLPSIKLVMIREDDLNVETSSGVIDVIPGKIKSTRFIDADLLGTTDYDYAVDFITNGSLKSAIEDCINGNIDKYLPKFKKVNDNQTYSTLKKQEVYRRDQEQLKELMKIYQREKG